MINESVQQGYKYVEREREREIRLRERDGWKECEDEV